MNWKTIIYAIAAGTIISVIIISLADTLLVALKAEPLQDSSCAVLGVIIDIAILLVLAAVEEIVTNHTKKP